MSILDFLGSAVIGAGAAGALVWLLRGWISERLKQSIAHEYSEKLERHKAELETKMQAVRHEYEINRLRTSLFFDHQRVAFSELLGKIAEVAARWLEEGSEEDMGVVRPVPLPHHAHLKALYQKHLLFLDQDCIMAMELLFDLYSDSFPHDDGSGGTSTAMAGDAYDDTEYVRLRIAALFQQKLGVAVGAQAARELALLGGIRIVNKYHFSDVGLPVSGHLKMGSAGRAAEAVARANAHLPELVVKLEEFREYLRTRTSHFFEAEASVSGYLAVLSRNAED